MGRTGGVVRSGSYCRRGEVKLKEVRRRCNAIQIRIILELTIVLAGGLLFAQAPQRFDIVITNGHIIDGTGSPWYSGDVGIRDGKIAAIGNLTAAQRKRTIDTADKV